MYHETDDDDHGHARHDVGMILDDELVTEYGQVFVGRRFPAFDRSHFRKYLEAKIGCGAENSTQMRNKCTLTCTVRMIGARMDNIEKVTVVVLTAVY